MTTGNPDQLRAGRFAKIKDNTMAPYGIKKGSTVYLAGELTMQKTKHDPYTLQVLFVCALVDAEGHIDNGEGKGVLINPKRLVAIPKGREAELAMIREADFRKIEDEASN